MVSGMSGRRLVALSVVVAVVATTQVLGAPIALGQEQFTPISGSGSSWSFNALDQWRRNVKSNNGITINFSPSGSSIGRAEFGSGVTDFGVSEIEYGLTDNNVIDPPPNSRSFAYMPIVAGGTAFMYNLKIGNNRVTNLRLSGENITKIFSRQITNWSDPAIKADNPGLTLPARPIVPVVRSDGSGTTAQFTRYMAAKYGAIWDSYCGRANCGFTSNFPVKAGVEAKNGSNGVAGVVASPASEGAITYVEYSYARNSGFPVAKVLNDAGYYVDPKATSVAVALTQAVIRPDLTSDLSKVYSFNDPRTYPLSSYSYMILPTDLRSNFTEPKGRTLSTFAYYFLCQGQQQADSLGYSPLPVNLVREGVKQVARIPGTTNALSETNLVGCNNPTFDPANPNSNKLAEIAPQPAACDKAGPTQCGAGATPNTPTSGGGGAGGGAATNGGTGPGGTGGGGPGGGAATGTDADGTNAGGTTGTGGLDPVTGLPTDGATIDPETGQVVDAAGSGTSLASNVSAIPVQVALPNDGQRILLAVLAIVLLVALILGPPLVSRTMRQRRGGA